MRVASKPHPAVAARWEVSVESQQYCRREEKQPRIDERKLLEAEKVRRRKVRSKCDKTLPHKHLTSY